MSRKMTNIEFVEKLKISKNENIDVIDEYQKSSVKLKCKCKICGNEYYAYPCCILDGSGCQKCVNHNLGKNRRMSHEEFIKKYKEKNKSSDNLIIIGKYEKSNIKIQCKCKICGTTSYMIPNNLLRGATCGKCSGNIQKTHEQFMEEFMNISKKKNEIEIIGTYKKAHVKIKCKCKKCNTYFYITPSKLLQGHGCSRCAGKLLKTQEEFIADVKKIHNDIHIIGKYKNDNEKVECKCLVCGHIWSAKATNILHGTGCPNCRVSKMEKKMAKILEENNIEFEQEVRFDDCRSIRALPFDFYIKSKSVIIECDGRQHFMPSRFSSSISKEVALENFKENKMRDKIKEEYCRKHNIKLIRIPYWKIKNMEKILIKENIISGE